MKRKLAYIGIVCLLAFVVWAASPSFSDFLANQFAETTDKKVAIKSGAVVTNTTTYVAGNASVSILFDNGANGIVITKNTLGTAITIGTRNGDTLLSYNPHSIGSVDAMSLNRAGIGGLVMNNNGTSLYDQSNNVAIIISQQSDGSELLSTFGNLASGGNIWQSPSSGSNYLGNDAFLTKMILQNGIYNYTNPVTAGVLDCDKAQQITNCSANPTFTGIAYSKTDKGFGGYVLILANGADRTCTFPANVHVYPGGTMVATNGSCAIFSYFGVPGQITNGVFLPMP